MPKANGPIAKVNGEPVPPEKFNKQIETLAKSGRISPKMVGKIKDSLIKKVVDQFLIDRAIDNSGVKVSESEMQEHLDRLRQRYKESAKGPKKEATLEDAVSKMGVSKEDFRQSVRKSIGIRKLLKKRDLLQEPTDKELKSFYDRNKKRFQKQEKIHLSQIVFKADGSDEKNAWDKTEQKAMKVRDSIETGNMTFEKAAKKHSDGTKSESGGDLGFLPTKRIKDKLGGNFHSIITQMKDGGLSEPIRSAYGWHLIKRVETKEKQTVPFEKVKAQLKRQLRARRMKKGLKKMVKQLKQEADIQMLPENIE
jgi:parvulin-like peptidyl-prolyl isomerase